MRLFVKELKADKTNMRMFFQVSVCQYGSNNLMSLAKLKRIKA